MPVKVQKIASHGAPISGLVRADFKGGDSFALNGYWMHPTRRGSIEVPIFQHEFYPKLDHTALDIKQNIDYRTVIVPSVADLHAAGIETDKAIFVAEVSVHPRYIKHSNFFNGEFPASIKSLSRQNGIVYVFPACDMPTARLKRKQVLAYYRRAFSPLYIKGRHYTSGRMSFFFVAPSQMTMPLRKSLNLESLEESWHYSVGPTLRRQPKINYERELAKQIQREINNTVLPVVSSQFNISLNSNEGRQLQHMMNSPELAHEVIAVAGNKPKFARLQAIKNWVSNSFWPRLKGTVSDEMSIAFDQAVRYSVKLAISLAFDNALDRLKTLPDPDPKTSARKPSAWRTGIKNTAQKVNFNLYDQGAFGLGQVKYVIPAKSTPAVMTSKMLQISQQLKQFAVEMIRHLGGQIGVNFPENDTIGLGLIKLVITSDGRVDVSLNTEAIEDHKRHSPHVLGDLQYPEKVNRLNYHMSTISGQLSDYYNQSYAGEV